jgi:CrcB protein
MPSLPVNIALVALGGAAGAVARYGTSWVYLRLASRTTLPFGTLAANLIGCLLIGYLNGLFMERLLRPELRYLLIIGVLGGYTTFSAFGWETAAYLREGEYLRATLYLLASDALGVIMVMAGFALSRLHLQPH